VTAPGVTIVQYKEKPFGYEEGTHAYPHPFSMDRGSTRTWLDQSSVPVLTLISKALISKAPSFCMSYNSHLLARVKNLC
jgi:hypothetical protein